MSYYAVWANRGGAETDIGATSADTAIAAVRVLTNQGWVVTRIKRDGTPITHSELVSDAGHQATLLNPSLTN